MTKGLTRCLMKNAVNSIVVFLENALYRALLFFVWKAGGEAEQDTRAGDLV